MYKQLGTIDLACDAPPYPIVQACSQIGFQRPEDVRWARVSSQLMADDTPAGLFSFFSLDKLLEAAGTRRGCMCRHELPPLERFSFLMAHGQECFYLLGQCPRCQTIYWEPD